MEDTRSGKTSAHTAKTPEKYDPSTIEPKWQAIWEEKKTYQPDLSAAAAAVPATTEKKAGKLFYNLMMFPYPSAEGLHVGNMYAFTGADVYGRFQRMQGHVVFEPIGLDGFGIHSENYALKVGSHPMDQAAKSEANFYRQQHTIGNSYAWNHTVETWKPDYYKWTQWVFTELFKAGLAYRAAAEVNWCPSCKTVLADEQVIDSTCERCGTEVEKRSLKQWFFRITGYAERLLQDLETIDWTEKVKIAQRNWIGKSEGARVKFIVPGSQFRGTPKSEEQGTEDYTLEVFTTRPDTLHGATFMVVSPEHPLVKEILSQEQGTKNEELTKVRAYVEQAGKKSDKERREGGKEKTGVFSGLYAVNPVNLQQIPIWIADYVLMGYGTGAIMAVPAHDQRDYDFAKTYDLPIIEVVSGGESKDAAYTGTGQLINSAEWNGWKTPEAKKQATAWLADKGVGEKEVTYHLRDWLISRQRYWGAPIPMIYCEACAKAGKSWFTQSEEKIRNSKSEMRNSTSEDVVGWYPEENLPVLLPHIDDYRPVGTGKAPLANHPEFYETTCPGCGGPATRETDVADTFLDSGWYFLRYLATDLADVPFPMPKEIAKSVIASKAKQSQGEILNQATGGEPRLWRVQDDKGKNSKISNLELEMRNSTQRVPWLPINQYIGGAEHSVLHLLYARFIYKVFRDLGYIPESGGNEPFPKFFAHGLIIKDGAKMSKSKGNVIVPDDYIKKYGADTLRTYLMFLGPFSEGGDFQDAGIDGINRFLKRVWKLFATTKIVSTQDDKSAISAMHRAIQGVTSDMSSLRYNTAIAKIMTWYNALSQQQNISKEEAEAFLKLLAPFAPHMSEELYQSMNKQQGEKSDTLLSIHLSPWPEFDEAFLIDQKVTIAIQVNGKLRDTVVVPREEMANEALVTEKAKASEKVQNFIEGKAIRKAIFVPGKILNLVV